MYTTQKLSAKYSNPDVDLDNVSHYKSLFYRFRDIGEVFLQNKLRYYYKKVSTYLEGTQPAVKTRIINSIN